jgi:hypothetical protein
MAHIPILGGRPNNPPNSEPGGEAKFDIFLAQDPVLGPLTANQQTILRAAVFGANSNKDVIRASNVVITTMLEKVFEQLADIQATQKAILEKLSQ